MSGFSNVVGRVQRSAMCLLVFVATAGNVCAQKDWTGPAGVESNWTDPANWGNNPAPTDYCLIRNGGIAVIDSAVTNNDLRLGGAIAGSTLRVKTGGALTGNSAIRLGGTAPGHSGTLDILGGDVTLGGGYMRIAHASGTTGIVNMTSGTLSVPYMRMSSFYIAPDTHGGLSTFNHSGGDVSFGSGSTHTIGGGTVGERDASYLQTGGTLSAAQIIYIGQNDGSTGLYSISNAVMNTSRAIHVGEAGTGRMEIRDDAYITLYNANAANSNFRIGNAAGGHGTVEMTGGTLDLQYLYLANGGTGIFQLKGRTLKFRSYLFQLGVAAGGNALFEQTGGLLDLTESGTLYLTQVAGTTTRYHISGGTIDSVGDILIANNSDVGAFRVTGSAPSITFRRIRNDNDTPFLLEFVLDKSLNHLSPMNLTYSSAYRTGDLRVGFDGGIVLTQTNAFTVIRAGGLTASPDYTSRPDPDMWTETLVENVDGGTEDESRITLAGGYKMAALDMNGTTSAGFAARAMGHVTLAGINTARMDEGLAVFLDVDTATYGKTPADLVSDLIAAGYTNSTTQVAAPYDVMTVIPKAFVEDGEAYFAWDFTDVTTGTTNATVSAVSFSTWPIKGTLISIR